MTKTVYGSKLALVTDLWPLQPYNSIPYELLVYSFDLFSVSRILKFLSVFPKLAPKILVPCLFKQFFRTESFGVFLDIFESVIK